MLKRLMFSVALVLFGSIFIYSNTTLAKEKNGNNENPDMNLEEFNQLIDNSILPDDISYDEWIRINDESLFDELEVPNVTISNGYPDSSNVYPNSISTIYP